MLVRRLILFHSVTRVTVWNRDNRHKLEHRKVPLSIRKHFFHCEHWHRLPREIVEFPLLKIFKRCLDMVLALGGPAWAGQLYKMSSRRPFQPQPFCDFCVSVILCSTWQRLNSDPKCLQNISGHCEYIRRMSLLSGGFQQVSFSTTNPLLNIF